MNNQSTTSANNTAAVESTNNATSANATPTGASSIATVSIVIESSVPTNGQFYHPGNDDTSVGSMMNWVNDDSSPHSITSGIIQNNSPAPNGVLDSGLINSGESFRYVFDRAGEYPYYCTIHPWMTGKVTVS